MLRQVFCINVEMDASVICRMQYLPCIVSLGPGLGAVLIMGRSHVQCILRAWRAPFVRKFMVSHPLQTSQPARQTGEQALPPTRLVLVRHAETEANLSQVWQGDLDAP